MLTKVLTVKYLVDILLRGNATEMSCQREIGATMRLREIWYGDMGWVAISHG